MKIALFFTEKTSLKVWERGGFLSRGIKAYNKLAEFFDKFYFISYGDQSESQYQPLLAKNITILFKKFNWPSRFYSFLIPFIYWKELKDVDIFYSGQMQGAWAAVLAKIIFRKKFVLNCGYQWSVSARNWNLGKIKNAIIYLIELITYNAANHIVLSSQAAKNYMRQRYGISDQKITVIPNYIDSELFKSSGFKKPPRSIVFIGRLEEEKNIFSLFDALKELDNRLTVIGGGSLEKELKAYVHKNNLNVKFLGILPNDQLPKELIKNEIFILPSLHEGSPKALLEAMACGLAVIGADVPGIKEIIQHKENGFLCATDADSIRRAIMEVAGDESLRKKIGDNARKYVIENCDLNKKIEKEMFIFNHLC